MAYAVWSVTAGEVPTTTKWNILGTNDAGFNDGTAIGVGAITATNIATAAVVAAALATNALKLGVTKITSNFSTASATAVQITGGAVTITIPSGGRDVLLLGYLPRTQINAAPGQYGLEMWDGTVGVGTKLQDTNTVVGNASIDTPMFVMAVLSAPAAGSKTINLGLRSNPGGTTTATSTMAATAPGMLAAIAI